MKENTRPIESKPRYLTKSRFKLGMECPTKLFFTAKKELYADQKLEDDFLKSLAEGGFQVGELAKCYFPGGEEVTAPHNDYEGEILATNRLLQKENVVIYEAAIRCERLFVRADILVKRGNRLELIEVKAKSYDLAKDKIGDNENINSKWKPYLFDIAFQKYVLTRAFPQLSISAWLMLADKSTVCPTDGLNQKFKIRKEGGNRTFAKLTKPLTEAELSQKILCKVNVDKICEKIYKDKLNVSAGPASFIERIHWLEEHYEKDEKIVYPPSSACAKCEFRAISEEEVSGMKSGFKECWSQAFKWTSKEFDTPSVLDIWDYRKKKDKMIKDRRVTMAEVTEEDIGPTTDGKPGKSRTQRQWLQVEKVQKKDPSIWCDKVALRTEINTWRFPLHFIDFETAMVAIPFNKGRRPYEAIAFQFSHHLVREDGGVEHKGEYLNAEPGEFPNYEFIRALKRELEADNGSIFRYSNHENTMLVAINRQLDLDPVPPPDAEELKSFIRSITTATKDSTDQWQGKRTMIDLWALVKRYYYAPDTNGSNSIKKVLPAVLAHSKFLKNLYSQPIYGAVGGISSKNFKNKIWLKIDANQVVDPYKQLPKMFQDVSDEDFQKLCNLDLDEELREGGAAMTAYARLQFEDLPDVARQGMKSALLRYCELDTLAMVMIYQAWVELVN